MIYKGKILIIYFKILEKDFFAEIFIMYFIAISSSFPCWYFTKIERDRERERAREKQTDRQDRQTDRVCVFLLKHTTLDFSKQGMITELYMFIICVLNIIYNMNAV